MLCCRLLYLSMLTYVRHDLIRLLLLTCVIGYPYFLSLYLIPSITIFFLHQIWALHKNYFFILCCNVVPSLCASFVNKQWHINHKACTRQNKLAQSLPFWRNFQYISTVLSNLIILKMDAILLLKQIPNFKPQVAC